MGIYWGSTVLVVKADSWNPFQSDSVIKEVPLLPDPSSPSAICSVLQQGGRSRYRYGATLNFNTMAEYTSLLNDMANGSGRYLISDTVYKICYIESLSPPNWIRNNRLSAKIVWVEGS